MVGKLIGSLWVVLLLSPLFGLLPYLGWIQLDFPWSALSGSVIQSVASSVAVLLVANLASLGLMDAPSRWRTFLEGVLLLPSLLPTLFVLVSVLSLVQPFPFGLWGIVLIHALISVGFATVILTRLAESRFGPASQMAAVLGAPRWLTFKTLIVRGLWREQLVLGFTVFLLCMGSFAVPLVASGGRWPTLEVSIYELLRVEGRIDKALLVAVFQSLFLFALAGFLPPLLQPQRESQKLKVLPLPWWGALQVALLPVIVFGVGLLLLTPLDRVSPLVQSIPLDSVLMTFWLGMSVGLATFFSVLILIPAMTWAPWRHALLGLNLPSVSTTAMGGVLTFHFVQEIWRLPLILTLVFWPMLYRTYLAGLSQEMIKTKQQLSILGAQGRLGWFWVQVPQVAPAAGFVAALAAVWAMGDFAYSRFLIDDQVHLGMMVDQMLERYRMADAIVYLWVLFVCSGIVFFTFIGLGHVCRQKPLLRI